jgi:hypothetical protein
MPCTGPGRWVDRAGRGLTCALLASVALAGCRGGGRASSSDGGRRAAAPDDSTAEQESPRPLPPGCVQLLSQLQCWLRASGNSGADVGRAVGNARAVFEARPDAAAACERAANFGRAAIGSAGCGDLNGDVRDLPASALAGCAPGEHFFVRRDGHVSGCHRDCTTTDDCPAGAKCESTGSAAGGPVDEPFCE